MTERAQRADLRAEVSLVLAAERGGQTRAWAKGPGEQIPAQLRPSREELTRGNRLLQNLPPRLVDISAGGLAITEAPDSPWHRGTAAALYLALPGEDSGPVILALPAEVVRAEETPAGREVAFRFTDAGGAIANRLMQFVQRAHRSPDSVAAEALAGGEAPRQGPYAKARTSSRRQAAGDGEAEAGGESSLLEAFRERFPILAEFQPLVSGIDRQLTAAFPDEPQWRVVAALRSHVRDPRYLRGIAGGGSRHTLHGEAHEPVADEHRAHARQRLAELVGVEEAGETEQTEEADGDRTEALRSQMEADYAVIRRFRPLAKSAAEKLARALKPAPRWRVLAALQRHMDDPRYLQAVLHEDQRRDLNGEAVAQVTQEEREQAYQRLQALGETEDAAAGASRTRLLWDGLRARFPVLEHLLPLGSGVERELLAASPGQPAWRIIAGLRSHIGDPRYQRGQVHCEQRYHLDGTPASTIAENQRTHARQRLAERGFPEEPEPAAQRRVRTAYQGARFILEHQARQCFAVKPDLSAPRGPEATAALARAVLQASAADWPNRLAAIPPADDPPPPWEWLAAPEGGPDPTASEAERLQLVFAGIRFVFREQCAYLHPEATVAETDRLLTGPLPRPRVERLATLLTSQPDAEAWLAELTAAYSTGSS